MNTPTVAVSGFDVPFARPHYESKTVNGFRSWEVVGRFGYPGSLPVDALKTWAVCIELPVVTVHIFDPTALLAEPIYTADPGDPAQSVPITLVAESSDADNNPLTGSALQWIFRDGTLGTGESITFTLPAPAPAEDFLDHEVEVIAMDADGNSARATIVITVTK